MATEVVVEAAGPAEAERAAELAARLGFPMASGPVEVGFSLRVGPERVELIEHGPGAPGPVYVDFVGGAVGHRRRFGGGRGQSIAKAVGLKGGASPSVIDATAGLGRDGFVLAQLGCQVTLVERHPVSAALLEDGIARALHDPEVGPVVEERMRLVQGNAVDYLGGLDEAQRPDVVYLDPMFPKRQKSAQVKKEMVALQRIVGGDEDSDALLDAALAVARKRVVVKRPAGAPPLAGRRPSATIDTKKNRFDVYVIAAL